MSDLKEVEEIKFTYNLVDLLLNRKIQAVAKCGYCGTHFITYIKRTNHKYIVCPLCKGAQKTGLSICSEEETNNE